MIKKENLKDVLRYLNFEENSEIFTKSFDNFELKVDFEHEKLIYPENIKIHGEFTTTFNDNENFVVFESVHRLFSQGYQPEHIELEPKWKVGHGASGGRADILVRDNENKTLLIIECKTYGREFKKAWNETLTKPTQLFSYFQQDRNTKFLALYSSDFIDNRTVSNYYLINVKDNEDLLNNNMNLKSYKNAFTVEEIYEVWSKTYDKEYSTLGLFENNQAYEIGKSKFALNDLKRVSSRDIQGKYHEFATVLRQHSVSGREQAFDKLVNLFLCKVTDERENPEELSFYWKGKSYDNPFDFQDRLQKLYKSGMKKFLGEDITYIENFMVDEVFGIFDLNVIKLEMKRLLKEQKFFTNNDFAFIDVHNEKLFYQNFEILLKVSRMIQDISLTGSEANQFLGDMFEGFLDNGIKQSEGQFFTPMPIVKFIINSLPTFKKPKVIDYACGSGHFLNEYASVNKNSEIFGIEKEYRLSKVAKVSSFMYGTNVEIIVDNGLKTHQKIKDGSFDILIANPPYSVKGFLDSLTQQEREVYELYSKDLNITANNSIETFFIERAKQLLNSDGVAGIIVPSSILNKGNGKNIYVATREILIKYFEIVAIAEFGSGTFGKTGTNTVTLFLKRKSDLENLSGHFKELSEKIFNCNIYILDAFNDKELLKKYCSHINIDFEIYKNMLCNNLDSELFEHETFKEYKNIFDKLTESKNRRTKKGYKDLFDSEKEAIEKKELIKFIKDIEKDKFYFFALAYKNSFDVLVIKSPNGNNEIKKFLGYEWSNAKGNEGIKYFTTSSTIINDNDNIESIEIEDEDEKRVIENFNNLREIDSSLYNPKNLDDKTKLNSLIKDNFNNLKREIPENLKDHVSYYKLVDMLDFSKSDFDKAISLSINKKIEIQSKWDLVKLGTKIYFHQKSKRSASFGKEKGKYPFFTSSQIQNKWVDIADYNIKSVIIGDGGNSSIFLSNQFSASDHNFIISSHNEQELLTDFIYIFYYVNFHLITNGLNGIGLKNISKTYLEDLKIPLPPLEIQEKIVAEIQQIDDEVVSANQIIEDSKREIEEIISSVDGEMAKLDNIAEIIAGQSPESKFYNEHNEGLPFYQGKKDFGDIYLNNPTVWTTKTTKESVKNDLLISVRAPVGDVNLNLFDRICIGRGLAIIRTGLIVSQKYLLYYIYQHQDDFKGKKGMTFDSISTANLRDIKVKFPPIEIQNEIVSQIEKLEFKINEAKNIVENSKEKKEQILKKWLE